MTEQEAIDKKVIEKVISITAENFGLDASKVWGGGKASYVVSARRVAIYVCYKIFKIPQVFIAEMLSINQSTVSKAVKCVTDKGQDIYSTTINYFKNYITDPKDMSLEPQKLAKATDTNKSIEINRLNKQVAQLHNQIRNKQELITDLQMQLSTCEDEGIGLRNELADREGDVEEAVDKLSKVQAKLGTTEKRLIDGQEKLKLAYIDNNKLREELAGTRALYENANTNYIKLKNKGILKFAIEKVAGCIKRN